MIVGVFGCPDKECNELNCGSALLESIEEHLDSIESQCEKVIAHPNTEFSTLFLERAHERGIEVVSMLPFELDSRVFSNTLIAFRERAAAIADSVMLTNATFSYSNIIKMQNKMKEDSDHWVVLSPADGCCSFTSEILTEAESNQKQATNLWKIEQVD